MVLTAENYYSKEANKEYMSVSQYKDFAGTYGKMACEFSAVEKLEERWEQKKTTPLLVGSYVDSYFEGTLEEFKKENPEIFTQKGELKANYKQAERIIARMERGLEGRFHSEADQHGSGTSGGGNHTDFLRVCSARPAIRRLPG